MISLRSYMRALGCLSVLAAPLLTGCGGGASGTSTVPKPSPFSATQYTYAGIFGPPVTDGSNAVARMEVDSSNNVYLAQPGAKRVQEFKSDGTALTKFGTPGNGNGQFGLQFGPQGGGPLGIAIDAAGSVYVADGGNHRVEKFSADGTYLSQFDTKNLLPSEVVVDAKGNITVAGPLGMGTDNEIAITGQGQVYRFNSAGTFQAQVGSGSSTGLAVDAAGNLYVSDAQNNRVEVFKADGTFLFQFGTPGIANGQFANIEGITLDGGGNIYVADLDNSRIEKFKSDGTYLAQIATNVGGSGARIYPQNVAVDGSGTVYVSDANHPVQVYHPTL